MIEKLKIINPPEGWRPVSIPILAIFLAMLLSLTINVFSGFEEFTSYYTIAVILLVLALCLAAYYSWGQIDAQERISRGRSTSKEASHSEIKEYEDSGVYDYVTRRRMRVAAILAWLFAIAGCVLFIFAKYDLRQIKVSEEFVRQVEKDNHTKAIIMGLSDLKEQVKQLQEVLENRMRLMPKPSPPTPGNQGGPKKPAASRGRRG